jgi:hypothetical protein
MLTAFAPIVRRATRLLLGWLDDRSASPIMREHINDGSRRYFEQADEDRGRSELDLLFDGVDGSSRCDDAATREDTEASLADITRAARITWLQSMGFVVLGAASVIFLLAAFGRGPFAAPEAQDVGARLERLVFGTLGIGVSVVRGWEARRQARLLTARRRVLQSASAKSATVGGPV